MSIQQEELINDFEIYALIGERVKNKFLNFEFFWKDFEKDANTLRTFFFCIFSYLKII